MNKFGVFFTALFVSAFSSFAQVDKHLNDALTAYKSKNYKDTNYAIQQALAELSKAQGEEILKMLPAELNGMKPAANEDQISAAALLVGGGTSVSRSYYGANDQSLRFTLTANSPMVASVNAMMKNPLMYNQAGNDIKMVTVAGRKAMLSKTSDIYDDAGNIKGSNKDLQIPFGESIIVMAFTGISDEATILKIAEKIDYAKLVQIVGE